MTLNLNLNLDALREKLAEQEKTNNYVDDRFYTVKRDDHGNAVVYMRFLPPPQGEDMPWVLVYRHFFELNGMWVVGNCPTTIGEKCPVCEYNSELWRSNDEVLREKVRKQKRRKNYIANVYIEKDKNNPENNGKVFLFRFGPKIFDYIKNAIQPEFDDQEPFNPFDPINGRPLILRARVFEKQVQYDRSEWGAPTPMFGGDEEKIMSVLEKTYSLKEFLDPSQFDAKQLEERLQKALGNTNTPKSADEADEIEIDNDAPASGETNGGNGDDDLERFRQLLNS